MFAYLYPAFSAQSHNINTIVATMHMHSKRIVLNWLLLICEARVALHFANVVEFNQSHGSLKVPFPMHSHTFLTKPPCTTCANVEGVAQRICEHCWLLERTQCKWQLCCNTHVALEMQERCKIFKWLEPRHIHFYNEWGSAKKEKQELHHILQVLARIAMWNTCSSSAS